MISIKYFGKIAEITGVGEEQLASDSVINAEDLKALLYSKYPALESEDFKISIDRKIATADHLIQGDSEIALLPPFAGG